MGRVVVSGRQAGRQERARAHTPTEMRRSRAWVSIPARFDHVQTYIYNLTTTKNIDRPGSRPIDSMFLSSSAAGDAAARAIETKVRFLSQLADQPAATSIAIQNHLPYIFTVLRILLGLVRLGQQRGACPAPRVRVPYLAHTARPPPAAEQHPGRGHGGRYRVEGPSGARWGRRRGGGPVDVVGRL